MLTRKRDTFILTPTLLSITPELRTFHLQKLLLLERGENFLSNGDLTFKIGPRNRAKSPFKDGSYNKFFTSKIDIFGKAPGLKG